ncbi:hypothetical protein FKM82_018908 [Ascaphus truei]
MHKWINEGGGVAQLSSRIGSQCRMPKDGRTNAKSNSPIGRCFAGQNTVAGWGDSIQERPRLGMGLGFPLWRCPRSLLQC